MLIRSLYYKLKPFIPATLRLEVRRWCAQQGLEGCAGTWPIYEASGRSPGGWPGWAEGKEFAFVLSHDVEGLAGLNRCRRLAEMEMEHGFRSSFHFVVNGDYEVPVDLLEWLRRHGFEIGVRMSPLHSRNGFEREVSAVNRQLLTWGATGFRADGAGGRMDWLHGLNIEYDASTVDVDPFKPKSGSVQTVFPFWVPRPDPEADALRPFPSGKEADAESFAPGVNGESKHGVRGYLELPCTLARADDLFVVLQEQGIDLWRKKLQWLAGKGAMALLNTPPDYMAMPGQTAGAHEYPVQHYRDFLKHVRSEYAGVFWHALPKEVAAWCRQFRPVQARPARQVAMVSYSYYESDNRVRRYAETLAQRGDKVKVFCIGSDDEVHLRQWKMMCGVELLKLQSRATPESGKLSYAWRLCTFFLRALIHLGPRHLPDGCDLLHVHNIPDFLVFAGLRLKLRGAPIILDIHDIFPELYESKFENGRRSRLADLLRRIESWSCSFADHVIIANHVWKRTLLMRSSRISKTTALVNNVDLNLFSKKARQRDDDRIILLYPGTLNHHQGLDIAIDAVHLLIAEVPNLELHIYGSGQALPELKQQALNLKLGDHVRFYPGVPLEQVSGLMANADIGIVPKRAEGFGGQAYSTKIMEFMSQGIPVVLSRTKIDSFYFNDSVVAFFESGKAGDMARAIRRLIEDRQYRQEVSELGFLYARANSWESVKNTYLDLVDRLTRTPTSKCS